MNKYLYINYLNYKYFINNKVQYYLAININNIYNTINI